MKVSLSLLFLLSISFCFYSFSTNDAKSKVTTEAKTPEFSDNGRAVDSLKNVYHCEEVTYDNWGEILPSDSCLTVCFVNGTEPPRLTDADKYAAQFKGIASAINKSLKTPQNYKSFYIIFVKKDTFMGEEIRVHSAGGKILRSEL